MIVPRRQKAKLLTSPSPSVTFRPMWISSVPAADGIMTSVSNPTVSKLSG